MRNGVVIDGRDNVVVAIYPLKAGDEVCFPVPGGQASTLRCVQDVPLFHKVARVPIAAGAPVIKYGEYIGIATQDIAVGEHVHTHNCASTDELKDQQGVAHD